MKLSAIPRAAWCAVLFSCAVVQGQDSLQLTDGRFVIGPSMTRTPEGVTVHFKNGDVFVPKELVKEASVSKSTGGEEKLPPEASEKLAAGFVRFEGKWIKPDQRDRLLEDRRLARMKKIKAARDGREWRNRKHLETANFKFEYTIDEDVLKNYAELMETYFRVFTKEWGITKPPKEGRMKVCFYHDRETFEQVGGAKGGVIGYYRFVDPRELNFFYDRMDERLTVDVMFHEANHYLTHLIDLKFGYPPWINESLAEYYGASEWDPKAKKMKTGALQDGRLTVIQAHIMDDKFQTLSELMSLKHGEFTADHYAWGWSFVHFLMQTPKYASKFKTFYKSLASDPAIKRVPFNGDMRTVEGGEVEQAFKRYLGVKDMKALEKEWHDYVRGLQPASPRGLVEAGQMYLSMGAALKATRFFQTAIDKGFATATAYVGLGRAHLLKQKQEEAVAAFTKAVEKDPLNGELWFELAQARTGPTQDDPEAVRLCRLALELDPDNAWLMTRIAMNEELWKQVQEPAKPGEAADGS